MNKLEYGKVFQGIVSGLEQKNSKFLLALYTSFLVPLEFTTYK